MSCPWVGERSKPTVAIMAPPQPGGLKIWLTKGLKRAKNCTKSRSCSLCAHILKELNSPTPPFIYFLVRLSDNVGWNTEWNVTQSNDCFPSLSQSRCHGRCRSTETRDGFHLRARRQKWRHAHYSSLSLNRPDNRGGDKRRTRFRVQQQHPWTESCQFRSFFGETESFLGTEKSVNRANRTYGNTGPVELFIGNMQFDWLLASRGSLCRRDAQMTRNTNIAQCCLFAAAKNRHFCSTRLCSPT